MSRIVLQNEYKHSNNVYVAEYLLIVCVIILWALDVRKDW